MGDVLLSMTLAMTNGNAVYLVARGPSEEDLTKVRSERSELLNEIHMTFDEKLASGLK